MKLKYILSLLAIVAISKSSFAQYANDAVKFSTAQPGSTSRIKAVGNAGTAIGGDLSSISINPAGLGFFTKSEFSLTPEYNKQKNNANYLGNLSGSNQNNGNVANAGIVFYTRLNTPRGTDKEQGWLSINFGAGYSHTNNFNEKLTYNGTNPKNSITDYYGSLANSGGIDFGLPSWAYDHNLIDRPSSSSPYDGNALPNVAQVNNITRTGGQSEVNMALGANYSNKLYLGFSVGVTDLEYKSTNVFNEAGSAQIIEGTTTPVLVTRGFNNSYSQYQTTKGSGINVKLGAIYKLDESLRVGLTFTTPTFLSIDDVYSEQLNTSFSSGAKYANGPEDYPLSYTMRTPYKAAAGLSYFFKQYGFITGDVEFIDYSTTRISSSDAFDATYDNNQIKANYRSVVNTRVGAEIRPIPAFALRGGYGMTESPSKTNQSSTKTLSGGLGYRFGSYYVDATYQHITGSYNITPYTVTVDTPVALVNRTNDNFFLTVGFRY